MGIARDNHGRFCAFEPLPIQHFEKGNLTAARARLAELRRKEEAQIRMVTPAEELPMWKRFDPKLVETRNITREFFGDPQWKK